MRLRPRQDQAVNAALDALAEYGNTLLVAPTGAGKTVMLSATTGRWILGASTHDHALKGLVVQHRDELTDQNIKKFQKVQPGLSVSVYDAAMKSWNGRVVFGMIQTLARNLKHLQPVDILTTDEAHHRAAQSYQDVAGRLKELNPNMVEMGVTATPNRGDGKGLRMAYNNVCDQITIGELIASGHLVPPRTFVIDVGAQSALKQVRKHVNEFDMRQVEAIMDKSVVTDAVVNVWLNGQPERGVPSCRDRKTIVFCSTNEHACHVTEAFKRAGVNAVSIRGDDKAGRKRALDEFERGSAQVLVNVAIATEGYDYPPTACVILLRPSSYKSTLIQMVGRGLRTIDEALYPGVVKTDCVVLDFGTASLTHGSLEDDANLNDRPKGQAPKKDCPQCEARVPVSTLECPFCGFEWERPEPGVKTALTDFVMTEVDLLAKSDFKWIDIWGKDDALMSADSAAWAGIFWYAGVWHAVAGNQSTVRHLGMGERLVALAMADDWMNEYAEASPSKIRKWARTPATEKQRQMLKLDYLAQMSLYEAMCRITFKLNQSAIQGLVLEHAQHQEAA
jgi:superfamily II DNA or RNA helicase